MVCSGWLAITASVLLSSCSQSRPADYFAAPPITGTADAQIPRVTPKPGAADTGLVGTAGTDAPRVGEPRGVDVGPSPTTADAADARSDATGPTDSATSPKDGATDGTQRQKDSGQSGGADLPNFAALFRRLSPSVVNIYTSEEVRRLPPTWGGRRRGQGTSLGSGIIIDAAGYIITNAHVVENAVEIRLRFHDGDELPARLVGLDPVRDLALLKVDSKVDLIPVRAGDSDKLSVGDWVLAIGNPFGLSHTLTKGIVSAKGRVEFVSDTMGYMDLIQTDAAINEGNSGGPLFDLEGKVVGVATAVSAEGRGISFAIPWNAVTSAIPRLKQGGQVSRSWLGVYLRSVQGGSGTNGGPPGNGGVVVTGVVDDSPAAKAAFEPGDVVVEFDGRRINSSTEFRLAVASSVAGKAIPVVVLRGPKRIALTVTLREVR